MDISMDLYRVFCEVARQGNLSRAAESLYVSQSAVSQSIKQLEEKLGGQLFNRTARGVTLTTEGKTLFGYADSACRLIENAEKKFTDMQNMQSGIIKIGASDTVCSLFLLKILHRFHQSHPDIHMQVANRTSRESIELLKRGEVDMAFVNLPIDQAEELDIKQIKSVTDCFVAGTKYAHATRRTLHLKELCNYPLLMLERSSNTRRQLDHFLASRGIFAEPSIELGSMDLLLDFAKIGLGISAVIEQAAEPYLKSGELYKLQLAEPLPKRGIGLAVMKGVNLSFAAAHFAEEASKNIK